MFEDVLKGVKSSVSAGFNTTAVYDNQPENQWEIIKILQTDTLWILVNYYIKIKECI